MAWIKFFVVVVVEIANQMCIWICSKWSFRKLSTFGIKKCMKKAWNLCTIFYAIFIRNHAHKKTMWAYCGIRFDFRKVFYTRDRLNTTMCPQTSAKLCLTFFGFFFHFHSIQVIFQRLNPTLHINLCTVFVCFFFFHSNCGSQSLTSALLACTKPGQPLRNCLNCSMFHVFKCQVL